MKTVSEEQPERVLSDQKTIFSRLQRLHIVLSAVLFGIPGY